MDTLSKRVKISILLIILAAFTIVCASSGGGSKDQAAVAEGPLTATIIETSGTVQVLKAVEGVFNNAAIGQQLENNDQVLTHEDGRARIDLSTGTIIRLSPLSNFTFESMGNTDSGVLTRLRLEIGRLWVILNGGAVEVDTPSGLASVRGSYLHVWVRPEENTTMVTCLEGECTLGNDYGTVSLVAGQSASISGVNLPPSAGKMSDSDVDEWLQENPEATQVLLELTATVAAGEGVRPEVTLAPSATPLVINTRTPTITNTAVSCGPPPDWVLHTVLIGETFESLAAAYQVSVAELQNANCRGSSTAIVVGETLFVPNVATITPTPTNTPPPTSTSTPMPAEPTATATPSNYPTVFSSPVGPVPNGDSLTDSTLCTALYSINAVDEDGISEVKMIYTLDKSLPEWTTAVGQGHYKLLSAAGGGTYEGSYSIPSYEANASAGGWVKYRFAVKDSKGVISYFPADKALKFNDNNINCGAPTNFVGFPSYPETAIVEVAMCPRDYIVTATDLNGIDRVELWYKLTDTSGTPHFTSTITLGSLGGDDYGISGFLIDTTSFTSPVTVYYKFRVLDGHGNWSESSMFTFVDEFGCQ